MSELFPNVHLDVRRFFALPLCSNILRNLRRSLFFAAIFLLLLAAHLCHSGVLWEGDNLPLASALQMTHGDVLYRDVWFDKPLLVPAVYLLWGAQAGPVLRIAGALYALLACWLAFALAARVWTSREGYYAAALFAFFLTFDTHSAVLPLAADMLLLAPHLAAVLLVYRKQPFWGGVAAGVGFLFNAKGVFVLAACAVFAWPSLLLLAAGFAIPNLLALGWLTATGSLTAYIDQVWRWPALYAASPIVADPVWNGIVRSGNWLGFHAALLLGAAAVYRRRENWKLLAWAIICYAGVVLGWRFFPRYFLLLLPALTIAAARGITLLPKRVGVAVLAIALAVPLVRFGPRYVMLGNDYLHRRESTWTDLALDQDSREASRLALNQARPGATLYVWGYRPELYVYTQFRPASKYLDSQALTGVPADRHLTQSDAVLTEGTHEAREQLAHSQPDVLIDSLSLYNPKLSPDHYAELRPWLSAYHEVARTKGSVIYLRRLNTIGE